MIPRSLDIREWRAAQRSGGVSRAWIDRENGDPTGIGIEWMLHVRIATAEFRFATGSLDVVLPEGGRVNLAPYVLDEFEVTDSYTPGDGGAGPRSVSISLPGEIVDCAALISAGLMLAGDAELSIVFPGIPYIERRVVIDGDVVGGVTFGAPGEPVEFKASDPSQTSATMVTGSVVDLTRFPTADDTAIGQRFPLVFSYWDRVNCLQVDGQTFLICVPTVGLTASSFGIYVDGQVKSTVDANYGHTVALLSDQRGQAFWGVTFTGSVTIDGESIQASVSNTATDGGRYLHQLVEYLLGAYTQLGRRRINYDLIGGILGKLGSIPTAFLVNGSGEATSADAFSLCEQRIAKSFPMLTFVWMDGKYGPVVTDGRAPPVLDFVEGSTLLRRVSAVQESDKADLVNRFTVRGGYDSTQQTYTLVATRDSSNSVLCSRSEAVVGTRDAEVLDADLARRQTDIDMIVDWLVFHRSVPSYYVEFDAPLLPALRTSLGINVRLYVPSLGWSGVVATVTSRTIRRKFATLGFRVWWANLAGVGSGGAAASGGSGGGGN